MVTLSKKRSLRTGQEDISLQKSTSPRNLTRVRCRLFRDRKQTGEPWHWIVWSFRTTSFRKTVFGKLLGNLRELECCSLSLRVRVWRTGASCNFSDLLKKIPKLLELILGREFASYSSTGIILHRYFHRLESMLVFTALVMGTNERISTSKSSGK